MSPKPHDWSGHLVAGRYRAGERVGEGAFGVVHRGRDTQDDRDVAIKFLKMPPSLGEQEREELDHALRAEERIVQRLCRAHPGVVRVLHVGVTDSDAGTPTPYLVLEWLEGQSLASDLAARRKSVRPFALGEAVAYLRTAVDALDAAHGQGVAHRDIKPPNLYETEVAGERVVKILDFGVAKIMQDKRIVAARRASGEAFLAFTPAYGAPEQFHAGPRPPGVWTDTYALALVLVEMLTLRPALDGQEADDFDRATSDPHARPTPRQRGLEVSDAVERVFARALALDPVERFSAAGELWRALSTALALDEAPHGALFAADSPLGTGSDGSLLAADSLLRATDAQPEGAEPLAVGAAVEKARAPSSSRAARSGSGSPTPVDEPGTAADAGGGHTGRARSAASVRGSEERTEMKTPQKKTSGQKKASRNQTTRTGVKKGVAAGRLPAKRAADAEERKAPGSEMIVLGVLLAAGAISAIVGAMRSKNTATAESEPAASVSVAPAPEPPPKPTPTVDACRQAPGCAETGACTTVGGGCVATAELDCRKSKRCTTEGLCSLDRSTRRCGARTNADCESSLACKQGIQTKTPEGTVLEHHCVALSGACVTGPAPAASASASASAAPSGSASAKASASASAKAAPTASAKAVPTATAKAVPTATAKAPPTAATAVPPVPPPKAPPATPPPPAPKAPGYED